MMNYDQSNFSERAIERERTMKQMKMSKRQLQRQEEEDMEKNGNTHRYL